ncbi:hypothetical protein [Streptomyces sp. NPDC054834]
MRLIPGSGHRVFCGPVRSVQGAVLSTQVPERPTPLGTTVGHSANVQVSQERQPVENEDLATFTATFASGAVDTFSVSRIARGLANTLGFEVFTKDGAATFELTRPAEFTIADSAASDPVGGYRRVVVGPGRPYIAGGLPMDFPSVGHGQHESFVWQARAFLEQIAGLDRLPLCPTLAGGLHNLRVIDAIVASSEVGGRAVTAQ